MEQKEQLEKALDALREFVCGLAGQAGKDEAYGQKLWQGISRSEGLLQELAYYYDKGQFLCRYEAIYGKNGSMEQAQFKIIEAMDYKGIVDSDALEAIEQELGYTE